MLRVRLGVICVAFILVLFINHFYLFIYLFFASYSKVRKVQSRNPGSNPGSRSLLESWLESQLESWLEPWL